MNGRFISFAPLFLVALLVLASPCVAEIVYLDANFNDKTIDAPIAKGGAAVGEPVWVDATAGGYVRSAPMATPSLEIADGSDCCWNSVWFGFLNNARVTQGTLVVTANLWITEPVGTAAPCRIEFRQSNPSAFYFLWIDFAANGQVHLTDADGPVGYIGTYVPSTMLELRVAIDLDAHTFDVVLNGQLLRDDEPFTGGEVGMEQLVVTSTPDADYLGTFYLDDLRVSDPDSVPVQPCTWGRLRRMFAP